MYWCVCVCALGRVVSRGRVAVRATHMRTLKFIGNCVAYVRAYLHWLSAERLRGATASLRIIPICLYDCSTATHTQDTPHRAPQHTTPPSVDTLRVCVCARVFSISGLWHDLMRWSCGIRAAARILRGADAHTKQRMVTMIRSGRSDVNCLSPTREGSCPMGSR